LLEAEPCNSLRPLRAGCGHARRGRRVRRPAIRRHLRSFPFRSRPLRYSATAAAYSLNVTVSPIGTLGYLTIWPTGEPARCIHAELADAGSRPTRHRTGRTTVRLACMSAIRQRHLDIDGYFTPAAQTISSSADAVPLWIHAAPMAARGRACRANAGSFRAVEQLYSARDQSAGVLA